MRLNQMETFKCISCKIIVFAVAKIILQFKKRVTT